MLPSLLLGIAMQGRTPRLQAETIARACAKAFERKDRAWFERHLPAAFVYQDLEGERQDRAAMLDRLDRWFHPLLYRVEPSLTLVSARQAGNRLTIVSDLKVISQPIRPWPTPVTETTVRVETEWLPRGKDWTLQRMVEKSTKKLVDGKPEP